VKRTSLSGEELKSLRAAPVTAAAPNRLRVAMGLLGLSQVDVVVGAQLTRPTVSDIYNFRVVDVKLSTLRALARFFGCGIDDLFPPVSAAEPDNQVPLPFRQKATAAR
jgi:transcriptional regulator with XRE-family HTH domain